MTPEERDRADAITNAVARFSKERKHVPLPSPTPIQRGSVKRPAETGNYLRYTLFFAIALAVNAIGFFAYNHHLDTKEKEAAEAAAHAQALADMQAAAQAAKAEAESLRLAMASFQSAPPQAPSQNWTHLRTITPTTVKKDPSIEYNVVKEPRPQPRPQVVQQAAPEPPAPPVRDRKPEHASIAHNYLRSKKSIWNARVTLIEQVPGWDGRYRTHFEITRTASYGNSTPNPRRYEVLTQEKDGQIIAIDITTKGY